MRLLTSDLYLLEGLRIANVYLISTPESLTLVDSGLMSDASKIVADLNRGGFTISHLRQVVITHAHADHTGSAAEIVRRSGAKVLAYKDEVPYIQGTAVMPSQSPVMRLFSSLSAKIMPNPPGLKVDFPLEDGQEIPGTAGYITVHAPGHTPGSMCLYHPQRRILIAGDALFNRHPLTMRPGLREPLAMISSDIHQVRESIRKLAALDVDILLCGHGAPILSDASEQIKTLKH